MSKQHDWRWLALVFLLAFLTHVAFFVAYTPDYRYENMEIDSWLRIAERLVNGDGYSWLGPNIPTAKRGPVVVYFFAAILWLFGQNSLAIIIAQWIVNAATCVVVYLLGYEVFSDRRVAFTSSFLFACYVPAIVYTFRAWSEPLFTLVLIVFALTFVRALQSPSGWRFALAGLFLGLAVLTRPFMQYYPLILLFLVFWNFRKRWREAAKSFGILSAAVALVVAPWAIRNYLILGHFIPVSTYSGWPLFESNHALGAPDFLRCRAHRESAEVLMETLEERVGPTLEPGRLFLHAADNGMSEYEVNQIAGKKAFEAILAYPDRYLVLSLVRFARLWFNVGYWAPPSLRSYMVLVLHGTLLLLVLMAFVHYRGPWLGRAVPLITLVVLNTAVCTAVQALVRYIVPIMPYMIIIASFTIVGILFRLCPNTACAVISWLSSVPWIGGAVNDNR